MAPSSTAMIPDPGWSGLCWASSVAPEAERCEIGFAATAPAAESLVARSDGRSITLSAETKNIDENELCD